MKVDCGLRNVTVAFGSRTCRLALALARASRWLLAGEESGRLAAFLFELCASAAVEGLGAAPGGGPPLDLPPQPSAKNAVTHGAAMSRGQLPCSFRENPSVNFCSGGANFKKLNFLLHEVDCQLLKVGFLTCES